MTDMEYTTPFIKPIRSPFGHYIYDVNRDSIVKVSPEAFAYLDAQLEGNAEVETQYHDATADEIQKLKDNGFLNTKRPREIHNVMANNIEFYMDNFVEQITLQVTQQCNLRCQCCVYSDNNDQTNRRHDNKRMSWEVVKKSIDFFVEHSSQCSSAAIGFYGGEPLLEFDLLKRCILYAKEQFYGKDLRFTLTTKALCSQKRLLSFSRNTALQTFSSAWTVRPKSTIRTVRLPMELAARLRKSLKT